MTTKNVPISWQTPLSEEGLTRITLELGPKLTELSATYSGYEYIKALITSVQQHALEQLGQPVDTVLDTLDPPTRETVQEITSGILQRLLPGLISNTHRELIVRYHARGLSTSDAVLELIKEDTTIARFVQPDAVGLKGVRAVLLRRLAYLKPGTARWPEKKYGTLWREERQQHQREIRNLPFTSPSEQAALLAKHAARLDDVLEHNEHSATDWQVLTNSLVRTLDSLRKVSEVDQQEPTNVSGAQLVAILERLTLALDAPEPLAQRVDTDTLVGMLEQLTLSLKSPEHSGITDEIQSIPADTNTDDADPA